MPLLKSSPPGFFLPTPLELVVVEVLELTTANSFKSSHLDANVSALVLAAKKIIVPFNPLQPFSLRQRSPSSVPGPPLSDQPLSLSTCTPLYHHSGRAWTPDEVCKVRSQPWLHSLP